MRRKGMALWIGVAALAWGCGGSGGSRVAITVTERGFEPERVTVEAGKPVTLVVTRRTDATCAKDLVLESEGIRRDLPLDEAVEITFTPKEAGELRYACGMDMFAGIIEVR